MDNKKAFKAQMLHLVFGFIITLTIGGFAVFLDIAAVYVKTLGVSAFTGQAIELTAHVVLVMDLVLFLIYLVATAYEYAKGMFK